MITVRDISKTFGTLNVLSHASIDVEDGKTCVVLGTSGSGKSVLLKSIVGLIVPEEGSIVVDDDEVIGAREAVLDGVRKRVGYVFQNAALFDSMTVGGNLGFALKRHEPDLSHGEMRDRVAESLEDVGLPEKHDTMPSELSGGQRKRIGLARTVILRPKYILYDEPTTGLDPLTTRGISELIVRLNEKFRTTSIAVTHDVYCTTMIADKVALLENGRFDIQGSLDEMRSSENDFLQAFFSVEKNVK